MDDDRLGKFVLALVMIASLSMLGYGRRKIFLTPGKLDAPITPVKWMGFPNPDAWAMSAHYFGMAHFYGVPYGWIGVALASFNGWLLGKARLETRGLFWHWWMHFLQDVAIFIFLVMGALTPGGA